MLFKLCTFISYKFDFRLLYFILSSYLSLEIKCFLKLCSFISYKFNFQLLYFILSFYLSLEINAF